MRSGRFGHGSFRFGVELTPIVRKLLVVTFGVWVVQVLFGFGKSTLFDDLFALDPERVLPWRPWQLLTYMFLHSAPSQGAFFNPLHILLNMLMLFLFGGPVERRLGPQGFLKYYLVCGIAGGVLTLLPPFQAPTVGASGAVLGVLTAFGLLYPDAPVLLLFIPVPAKILVIFLALLNLFSAAGQQGGISYIAHLGGMAAGYLMLRGIPYSGQVARLWQGRARSRDAAQKAELRARMDDILDKMQREGKESLSREDWRTLLDESKRMREK